MNSIRALSNEIDKLNNRFTVIESIGRGSYGQVIKCFDNVLHKIVALKKIRHLREQDDFEKKLYREVTILKKLDHPNINKLYDVIYVNSEDNFYLVLEYCQHDLLGLISTETLLPAQVKSFMKQILEALKYLAQNNIVHRDIKPANILVRDGTQIQIADFGLAREMDTKYFNNHTITLLYRPLELLLGESIYGSEVDIWSTAIVFYQMVTKKLLFSTCGSESSMITNIINIFGTPSTDDWPEVTSLPNYHVVLQRQKTQSKLDKMFSSTILKIYGSIVDQIKEMFNLNPKKRPTAQELLDSGAFEEEEEAPTICFQEIHQNYQPIKIQKPLFNAIARPKMPAPLIYCC